MCLFCFVLFTIRKLMKSSVERKSLGEMFRSSCMPCCTNVYGPYRSFPDEVSPGIFPSSLHSPELLIIPPCGFGSELKTRFSHLCFILFCLHCPHRHLDTRHWRVFPAKQVCDGGWFSLNSTTPARIPIPPNTFVINSLNQVRFAFRTSWLLSS